MLTPIQQLPQLSYQALDDLPEPVFWFDDQGDFVDVNQHATLHWGYTKEELLELSIFDLNPTMTRDIWDEHWIKKMNDPSTFESKHQKKDGTIFPVDITDNFVTSEGKTYCCAIIRDITERKRADQIARLSDFTVQSAGDAIFWLGLDGSILNVNQEAVTRYGYAKEELIDQTIFMIAREMSAGAFAGIWDRLKNEKRLVFEGEHFTRSGKKISVEVNANYFEFEGQEYTTSIVRDITDRKRKESALRGALLEIRELKEKLEAENNYLNEEIELKNNIGEIITENASYKKVLSQVEQVADTTTTALITGESGTGKELLARAIHQLSQRADRPMIKINCAALPMHMIESELFGHERGAFAGAVHKKIGKFELADQSTLFLDEIGEIPYELQSKLLRVLQEGEFERLGGNDSVHVDTRLIISTNKDLVKEIEAGRFREDLYYRINVFPIETIPLRKRKEDIPLLTQFFCQSIGKRLGKHISDIPQKTIQRLLQYDFPGNVRELENLIERAVITSKGSRLNLVDFNPKQKQQKLKSFVSLEAYQKQYIAEVLQHTNWRVSGNNGASVILGIPPTTLFSKIKKLGIKRSNAVEFD